MIMKIITLDIIKKKYKSNSKLNNKKNIEKKLIKNLKVIMMNLIIKIKLLKVN
jgi:hypothetical protein